MLRGLVWSVVVVNCACVLAGDEPAPTESEKQALGVMDDFMAAFNAADPKLWAKTLNYPHVRIAGGNVRVWKNAEEYATQFRFDDFRKRTGWHHSVWDYKKVLQSDPSKVHIAVGFTRFRADGSKIASYRSLYALTKQNGHWGVQARSSFAP